MISDRFRHFLQQETKLWLAENIITETQYHQLSERYQFDRLSLEARNRFLTILISLGGILLGIGGITWVAANWQVWSRDVKVVLLLSLFVGINTLGFYLWRSASNSAQPMQGLQRLGRALLLLGAIGLGANMALMAQMFHIGGSPAGLFLAWGIGVLLMAYSLRLTELGGLSVFLCSWGYFISAWDIYGKRDFDWIWALTAHWPSVVAIAFIPLAYWCRSRGIFTLAAIVIIYSLEVILFSRSDNLSHLWLMAIAAILPTALLWSYDDTIWPPIHTKWFQSIARLLSILWLAFILYILSFYDAWPENINNPISEINSIFGWTPIIDVILFSGLTILQWWRLGQKPRSPRSVRGGQLMSTTIACFLTIIAAIILWHYYLSSIPQIATFTFNVLEFLLSAGLIREGLARGTRGTFWYGMILLILQIITRIFEYDTDLLLKALVFGLCGVGLIVAGLWFERHLSNLTPAQED